MIPPYIPEDTPLGEVMLFEKLRKDPKTSGWVVLHSLDLQRHRTKAESEIDMVILAPGLGILCLEVKGCDVQRKDGVWIYPYKKSVEGPFRQASSAMHSLRDYVQKRDSSLRGLLFWSAAAFTRIQFSEESPEWHAWQVVDRLTLQRLPISKIISRIIEHAHQHAKSKQSQRSWYDPIRSRPSENQVSRLTSILRGNFECVTQPRSDIQHIEESILGLTKEQYGALDTVSENSRVIIKGLAGTGKTLLAIEAARRAASDGKRVLLLCFNRLLGDWIKSATKGTGGGGKIELIQAGHLHGLLRELAGSEFKFHNGDTFWTHELPAIVIDRFLSDDYSMPQFDLLLVDEAQDILRDEYLDVLELLLSGGLSGGQWVFFGDFEHQAIYLSNGWETAESMIENLRVRAPHFATFLLSVNCRNASPIAEAITLACNVNPGYSRFLHELEGASVEPKFWSETENQMTKLDEEVSHLRNTFKLEEIVVLSMNANERSCAGQHGARAKTKFISIRAGEDGVGARYASVHAFKGMEAPAIIITDITSLDINSRDLLYVAMSRARVRLVLLMHETCRRDYDKILEDGLGLAMGETSVT